MRLAPEQLVEPKAMVTLRPRHGMRMLIEARDLAFSENILSIETANLSS
jgi:hypothetical protein